MLPEILISLSGYHSEIWEKLKQDSVEDDGLQKYVSEPEKAMLEVLANISRLHVNIKENAAKVTATHGSVICRAVASSISEHHLAIFRRKVLDVESAILQRDSGYVGAYNIVPLGTIVGEFSPWSRRLQWLSNTVEYMRNGPGSQSACSGKDILDFLQVEIHTGYSDIEDMASQLLICAQKVWMRLLASWVLYGKLPSFGADDFFVRPISSSFTSIDQCVVDSKACPNFVSEPATEAIRAIGSALNQIRTHSHNSSSSIDPAASQTLPLTSKHLGLLESLSYPLNPTVLEAVLVVIDQSISQNALSRLLPLEQIIAILMVIQRFVLLGSGEFAVALIEHGAEKMASRQIQSFKPLRKMGRMDDLAVRDAELGPILSKAWDELAALQFDHGLDDEIFVFARKVLTLRGVGNEKEAQLVVSTWLPNATSLGFDLPSDSTLHLFLTPSATAIYSSINAYLLSVRRGDLQLASLWKVTAERRCYPTPLGPPKSATRLGQQMLASRRLRENSRSTIMRQHWATASKALFLINELGGYLHGEIIRNSWDRFDTWIREGTNDSRPGSSRSHGSRPGTASSTKQSKASQLSPGIDKARDPRTLARGHNAFLKALFAGLLLGHVDFVTGIKEFLNLIDHYVALFHRLQTIWEGLDLQEDDGVVDAFSNYAQDEKSVLEEMSRSRDLLEQNVAGLVIRLKDAEKHRIRDEMVGDVAQLELERHKFVPWKPRTMDRLIMKLDFLAGARESIETNDGIYRSDGE